MTKKPVDRERLKERWLSTQELSGGLTDSAQSIDIGSSHCCTLPRRLG
jgi:hypothetical protein